MKAACIIALALLQIALPVAARGAQAQPVRIVYSSISGAMAPLWVAHDHGFFRRQGLDVQLLYIGGGSIAIRRCWEATCNSAVSAPMPWSRRRYAAPTSR